MDKQHEIELIVESKIKFGSSVSPICVDLPGI